MDDSKYSFMFMLSGRMWKIMRVCTDPKEVSARDQDLIVAEVPFINFTREQMIGIVEIVRQVWGLARKFYGVEGLTLPEE